MTHANNRPHFGDPVEKHMKREFVAVKADDTVGGVSAALRGRNLTETIAYIYAVDSDGRLTGVIPTRRLVASAGEDRVGDLMIRDVVSLPSRSTLLAAAQAFIRHRFLALPVVDDSGRIVGVVDTGLFTEGKIDSSGRVDAQSIFQLIGVHIGEGRKGPAYRNFGKRFPWLCCNIAGGLACALISGWHEELLQSAVVLAFFIPMVLTLSESVSIQSMSITIQGLAGEKVRGDSFLIALGKELLVSGLLGTACGGVVAAAALLWKASAVLTAAIWISITLSMVTACLLGVALPTAVAAVRKNPHIASGPIVLAMGDAATLLFYLSFSEMLLRA